MTTPKISFCIITGNEEMHIERFLDSFGPAFDELCLVRAVANLKHDRTVSMAKEWCGKHGKTFRFSEYRNRGWEPGIPENADINPMLPQTWPHVDDFAAARNMSWDMATGDWLLWADVDDVLATGAAEKIRACSFGGDKYDMFFFTYQIRTSMETNFRERMFKRGISKWQQPVHENCRVWPDLKIRSSYESEVIYSHEPDSAKKRDDMRNLRILGYQMRYQDAFPFELHREYFYRWQAMKKPEDAEAATKWAEISQVVSTLPDNRIQLLLNMAQIMADRSDYETAIEYCWTAMRISPWMRDPWGWMAEYEIKRGNGKRAVFFSEFMGKLLRQPTTGMPTAEHFFTWRGLHLHLRALRAANSEDKARKVEDGYFEKHGRRFSLIHATRGRPEQAIKARDYFYMAARNPLGVEHIFAIDADDKESLEKLRHYRHVVVDEPRGCVKAWNAAAAASSGHILLQLSDDWLPCLEWDERIWSRMDVTKPQVLAISDNHRKDALMCMAILTRPRYEQQGREMFSPEYFGVFSDNEFSVRAYADGVVVDAREHVIFDHQHPFFEGKPVDQWDETHRRQNAPERYKEGAEIFRRRNPGCVIE